MKLRVLLFLALAAALQAQGLLPEIQSLSTKHETDVTALDAQELAAKIHAAEVYVTALDSAEKAAISSGQLAVVAALSKERDAAKSGDLSAAAPPELSKTILAQRKLCLDAMARVTSDFILRQQRVDADYLRSLTALQSRAPSNSELARQLTTEKANLLQSATRMGAKKLNNTRWSWHFSGKTSTDEIVFQSDGSGKHTNSPFQWQSTGARTFALTLPDGHKATITFNEVFTSYKGTDFNGHTIVEGERK